MSYKKDIQQYLNNQCKITSHKLRCKLIQENIFAHKCQQCNLTKWNNQPIPLQLHHIDGNHNNNNLNNIKLLCPNCHAQTDNYAGNKLRKQKRCIDCHQLIIDKKYAKKCEKCRNNIPTKQELEQIIWTDTSTNIAKQYNVTHSTIERWCKKYNISKPGVGYWNKKRAKYNKRIYKPNKLCPICMKKMIWRKSKTCIKCRPN